MPYVPYKYMTRGQKSKMGGGYRSSRFSSRRRYGGRRSFSWLRKLR